MAEVALVDVSKSYGAVEAVRGLSLSISDGEFLVCLKATVQKDCIQFSLEGSSPTAKGPINLPAPTING